MNTIRFNITMIDNAGNRAADALASAYGNVISSTSNYNADGHDLAIIEIPAEDEAHFRVMLDADDNVISY